MYYCNLCKGKSRSTVCENPSCPDQPCCGRPLAECICYIGEPGKMSMEGLRLFLWQCKESGLKVPNSAVFAILDFDEAVPEEYRNQPFVEYNDRGTEFRVHICRVPK